MFFLQVGGGDADADEDDDWREADEDCAHRLEGFFLISSVYLFVVLFTKNTGDIICLKNIKFLIDLLNRFSEYGREDNMCSEISLALL